MECARQNMPNFLDFGAAILFTWTAEEANRFGFASPVQAAIAVELILSRYDHLFAVQQDPGIGLEDYQRDALAAAERIPLFRETILNALMGIIRAHEFLPVA